MSDIDDPSILEGLVRHELGFWEVANKPTLDELREYYEKKYYQEARGSYEISYTEDELRYIQTKIEQRWNIIAPQFSATGSMLDVGCGEGFAVAAFAEKGWQVRGLDFSRAGFEAQNPGHAKLLVSGDLFDLLEEERETGNRYDVVWLQNVLEHVLNPVGLMRSLQQLTLPGGALVVTVPNDFSILQLKALKAGKIEKPFWVAVPDHMSYFSNESLRAIGSATGWDCFEMLGDFPVDWFLYNDASNYIAERSVGKKAHRARVELENLIGEQRTEDVAAFFSAIARLGMGRDLTAFFTPSRDD